ncbi:MAG: Gfo/Idh/MocA family oxidoreductase [Kiritimatiellales bacterium]|nr:Gfo/Idh/MocA family oxidoreductase [Kiritimatiellales bacterium]
MSKAGKPSRRSVLAAGAAVTAFNILPSGSFAAKGDKKKGTKKPKTKKPKTFSQIEKLPPNERLNIAFIGAGGKGSSDIKGCSAHNIVALCDVDLDRAAPTIKGCPEAKLYRDWRVMLDKEYKNLDAVVVSIPDHSHAVATMAAMQRGLGVYCQKPLTRTISEARIITAAAKKYGVVTQMGNQGHSNDGTRMGVEWIQAGVLGEVREVHCYTNRPIWPQGIVRPPAEPVPSTMDWDLWLGPAPKKPYSSQIAPFKWRGYWDYGCGALGDMAAHIMDQPVWALGLGAPESVEVEFERENPASAADTFPVSTIVTYTFGARGKLPPVTLKWFDGQNRPPIPDALKDAKLDKGGGIFYYGSKYNMMQTIYGQSIRIFPEADMQEVARSGKLPPKTIKRAGGQDKHYDEWLAAVKANDPSMAMSNFDYSGPLTEIMLLGCVAARCGSGTKLKWNSKKMTTNNDVANRYVNHEYRKGYSL